MSLHITSATVGREAPLTQVPAEQDQAARGTSSEGGRARRQDDSAAISDQGQRLAALGSKEQDELKAIAEAEQLARSLAARMAANPQGAKAAHGQMDPARVAQLLEG